MLPDDALECAVYPGWKWRKKEYINALAQCLGLSVVHLNDFLARLQRLLNIDGYTVLQVDRERNLVTLHIPLLQRQFALD